MKIGLYFGTFNPIHTGHLFIASYMADNTGLEQIWFVVTPQNPLKKSDTLANENDRLRMVTLALADDDRFFVCDEEFRMPRPSYTINTVNHLKQTFPGHDFIIIMGADNLSSFEKWRDYKELLEQNVFYVYPRRSIGKAEHENHKNIKLFNVPLLDISASFIRESIKNKVPVSHLLPGNVLVYIQENHLYAH